MDLKHPSLMAFVRLVAAISLLAVGVVHIQQYIGEDYRVIPTIGPLFLLNFIGGTVLGLIGALMVGGSVTEGRRLLAPWLERHRIPGNRGRIRVALAIIRRLLSLRVPGVEHFLSRDVSSQRADQGRSHPSHVLRARLPVGSRVRRLPVA